MVTVRNHIKGVIITILLLSIIQFALGGENVTMSLESNSNEYEVGQTVNLTGIININDTPAPDKLIGLQVQDENENTVFIDQQITDSEGKITSSFTIPSSSSAGKYTAYMAYKENIHSTEFDVETVQCVEDWACSEWSECQGGSRSRTCVDQNSCGTEENKPFIADSCPTSSGGSSGGGSSSGGSSSSSPGSSSNTNNEEETKETEEENESIPEPKTNETGETLNETNTSATVNVPNTTQLTGLITSSQTTLFLIGAFILSLATFLTIFFRSKNTILGIFSILLFTLILIPQVHAGSATADRILPETAGVLEELTVKINIDVFESDPPISMILSERLPQGFELLDEGSGSYDKNKGIIKWLFLDFQGNMPVEDTLITYILKTPSSRSKYAFNGVLNVDTNATPTEGDAILTVGCLENWQCEAWTQCIDGVQTRECEDLNQCGTQHNHPLTRRGCTESNALNDSPEIPEDTKEDAEEGLQEPIDQETPDDTTKPAEPENPADQEQTNNQPSQTKDQPQHTIIGNLITSPTLWNPILILATLGLIIGSAIVHKRTPKRKKLSKKEFKSERVIDRHTIKREVKKPEPKRDEQDIKTPPWHETVRKYL